MTGIGPVKQAPRALPSVAPRPNGVPASTATADFVALMRAVGQGSTPVSSSSSVGQAEWPAQSSRRLDIEAALAQSHMARRVPPSPTGRTGRGPSGTWANLPKSTDCNAAKVFFHDGTEEIASTCTQAHEIGRFDEPHKDPLARQDDPCGRDLVYDVPVPQVSAVPELPAVWPLVWVAWPFYPSVQHLVQAPRVRVWRKRMFYPASEEPADESGSDDHSERG